VTVTDANGCTATGTYLVGTVSTQEAATALHFSVQPNPSRGQVYILGVTPVRVELYNAWGLLVQEHRVSVTTLDLSTLPTGTYLVRVTDNNGRQGTRRVVVR
jgi:Secretion system C-terminal sorting domain